MEDAHNTLSFDSHAIPPSKATVAEASAFMQLFNLTIETKSGDSVRICYFHRRTQRSRRVAASSIEIKEDPTRSWSQQLTNLFPWATLDGKKLSGRLLGNSGRVDGLQGCHVVRTVYVENGHSAKVDDQALALRHLGSPLRNLGKLPKELRDEVYKHAFPRTFWQCYHTKLPGLTLPDVTHSSTLPVLLDVSHAVREEVLESAFCDRSLEVVIGTGVIAFNFPLHPPLLAGQILDTHKQGFPNPQSRSSASKYHPHALPSIRLRCARTSGESSACSTVSPSTRVFLPFACLSRPARRPGACNTTPVILRHCWTRWRISGSAEEILVQRSSSH